MINAINLGFTLSIVVLFIIFIKFDILTMEVIRNSIFGIIPVTADIYLGGMLRHAISQESFKIALLLILMVIGVGLILLA